MTRTEPGTGSHRRRAAVLALLLAAGCGEAGGESSGPAPAAAGPVRALAAGGGTGFASYSHVCAIVTGGVQCWGANESGQLGDGLLSKRFPLPARVTGLPAPAVGVAAGGSHTCAAAGGGAWCWGSNTRAQLGTAEGHLALHPRRVAGLPEPVEAVAAGEEHTCAVAAGALLCWGRDRDGSLGSPGERRCRGAGSVVPCSAEPVRLALPGRVDGVALGLAHGCARVEGEVWCWGRNDRGQLGDGGTAPRAAPARVALPAPVRALAAGRAHTCALVGDAVYCWGAGDRGQLGDGASRDRPAPVRARVPGAIALAAGARHTCAATGDAVWCWGDDREGQASGSARAEPRAEPARVEGVVGAVAALAAGTDVSCAAAAARVVCWGDDDFGQRGRGTPGRGGAGPAPVAAWDDGRLRDRDGDGRTVVACLGDSNTHPDASRFRAGWCERLPEHFSDARWRAVNRSAGGATAVSRSLFRAEDHLAYALENDAPDVVVLAYGTNDVLQGFPPEDVVAAYGALRARAREAGVAAFVALAPPIRPAGDPRNERIEALNDWLRRTLPPERLVDFWSGFEDADFVDPLHLGASGQAKRARAAWAALAAAGASGSAP